MTTRRRRPIRSSPPRQMREVSGASTPEGAAVGTPDAATTAEVLRELKGLREKLSAAEAEVPVHT